MTTTTALRQVSKQIDVQVGTLIFREALLLPTAFTLPSDTYSKTWKALNTWDVFALDRNLRLAGWNFFSVAGLMEASVIGSANPESTTRQSRLHKALDRILATARTHSFNCVEITGIQGKRFFGIPYITVQGQSRHIQESRLLQNPLERAEAQHEADT